MRASRLKLQGEFVVTLNLPMVLINIKIYALRAVILFYYLYVQLKFCPSPIKNNVQVTLCPLPDESIIL